MSVDVAFVVAAAAAPVDQLWLRRVLFLLSAAFIVDLATLFGIDIAASSCLLAETVVVDKGSVATACY